MREWVAHVGDYHVNIAPDRNGRKHVSVYRAEDGMASSAIIIDRSLYWIVGLSISNDSSNYLIPDMTLDDPAYDAPVEQPADATMFSIGEYNYELGEMIRRRGFRDQFNIMVVWAYVSLPA